MTPNLGIPPKDTAAIAVALNQLLADEHVLYIKTRNHHWNLTGPDFVELHRFLEETYNQTAETIDLVAERIQQIGYPAAGSMSEFLELATLKEEKGSKKREQHTIETLLADHEALVRSLRATISVLAEKYDDPGTVDLLTGIIQIHEKTAWMLRRYLG